MAAHTRRCRLRPASPASRAQLIRAALQAPRLGPAEPHAARARCPRAADPGPGRAPWAARARTRREGSGRRGGLHGAAEPRVARPRRGHGGLHPVLSPRGQRSGARLHGRPSPRFPHPRYTPTPPRLSGRHGDGSPSPARAPRAPFPPPHLQGPRPQELWEWAQLPSACYVAGSSWLASSVRFVQMENVLPKVGGKEEKKRKRNQSLWLFIS